MPKLAACPHCENHVKLSEHVCPHCGGQLRDAQGRMLRTATAVVLGLAAATACKPNPAQDPGGGEPVAEYGPAPAALDEPVDDPANEPVDEYGPPPTDDYDDVDGTDDGGEEPEPVAEYGPPPTDE